MTQCGQERVRHSAPNNEDIHPGQKIAEQAQLGGDLGAAHDRRERTTRRLQHCGQRLEFGLHGTASILGSLWPSPSTEACARCATEKASLSKMSPSAASFATKSGSFSSSPT